MRIGIYDPYLDDLGGGEKYMLTIAQCLSEDNDVTIFWDKKEDFAKIHDRFSLDITRCKIGENIFSSSFSFLKRILETSKYDAIIFLSDGSIPFVLSRKLFIHIQQPISSFNTRSIKSRLKLLRVNKFFFNSQYSKSFFKNAIVSKGLVLYPPVLLNPKNIKKENIVLNVGRFRVRNVNIGDYKKQDFMVDVFKKMINSGLKNWKFVIGVGLKEQDQNEFEKMKNKASGYPIEFIINASNKDLWEFYSKASIYWHASGFGEDLEKYPQYAEHFGISTVEAMGAGCVPVVIKAGGQIEIVKDGENGFLWGTEEELMAQTLKLTKDSKLLNKMSEEARERAKFFAGDRFCKEVRELVEK